MNRERIVEILTDNIGKSLVARSSWHKGLIDISADRILAALEEDRKGEVVLCEGRVDFVGWTECNGPNSGGKQVGQRGKLIFREDR